MKLIRASRVLVSGVAVLAFALAARAQPHSHTPTDEQRAPAKADKHIGDPYPLATCPITGKKLGSMGDPVVKIYDGREIRFCCPACPPKFEKDLAANLAKVDEKIIKDQGPLYPLTASVVTGKDLPAAPAKPYEFVYGNRLVRLGAESEKAEFLKDPTNYMADLDRAVIAKQSKDYPTKTCFVSGQETGGEMDKPVEVVLAGRLIRLCCKDCKKDLEQDPAKFISKIDEARSGKSPKPDKHDDEHHEGNDSKPHGHP